MWLLHRPLTRKIFWSFFTTEKRNVCVDRGLLTGGRTFVGGSPVKSHVSSRCSVHSGRLVFNTEEGDERSFNSGALSHQPFPSLVRREHMAVGVLALQGSFREHIVALRKLNVESVEVRKPEQLVGLSGLIIPGGESTTMAKLAEEYKLIPALREFGSSGKPIWGTCAGLIFLADKAVGQKTGGQALLGGLDVTVHRNYFGSQLNSFETELLAPAELVERGEGKSFRAVFIRAPAILDAGPSVEVLADIIVPTGVPSEASLPSENQAKEISQTVIVAVRQGNVLATAFHPELTSDTRWHSLFLKMVDNGEGVVNKKITSVVPDSLRRPLVHSGDLPIFRDASYLVFE